MYVQIRQEFRAMGEAKKLQDIWPPLKCKILDLAKTRNLESLLEAVTDDLDEGVSC